MKTVLHSPWRKQHYRGATYSDTLLGPGSSVTVCITDLFCITIVAVTKDGHICTCKRQIAMLCSASTVKNLQGYEGHWSLTMVPGWNVTPSQILKLSHARRMHCIFCFINLDGNAMSEQQWGSKYAWTQISKLYQNLLSKGIAWKSCPLWEFMQLP